MVCLSWAGKPGHSEQRDLMLRKPGIEWLRARLDEPILLVGANSPYDFGVAVAEAPDLLPLVFDAYRGARVCCVQTFQKLIDVALGMRKWRRARGAVSRATYALADLVLLYFQEHLEKEDTWRLRYALLDGVPIEEWPQDAVDYAIGDSVQALRVRKAQIETVKEHFGDLPNQAEQQFADWALHLMSMWAVRADAVAVDRFIDHCEEEIAKMRTALAETAIFKADGSRTMAEIRRRVVESCARLKIAVPMTDPSSRFPRGQVQTDKDALDSTDDPHLHVLAESMTFAKHLGQWGPVCRAAVLRPVCARYNVLVETGRTSCSGSEGQEGTNFQNPPRKGDVRPCFVPRPGYVYGTTDADTIELRAHAQDMLDMGIRPVRTAEHLVEQAQSGGPDLHEVLAGSIMDTDPREVQRLVRAGDKSAEDARQFAKIPGYGFPGGLGAPTFVAYAAGQLDKADFARWFSTDRERAVEKAQGYREVWFETLPENREYFRIVGRMIDRESGEGAIQQFMSGRIRGGVRFTAAANGFFQGRVADAMKEALCRLADECYTGRLTGPKSGRSVLYGSRPVMFLHDEPILEHPERDADERLERQRVIVVESLSRWHPDVPCTSSGALMRRWWKGAKPMKVNGRMVPTKPEKFVGSDGKNKIRWVQDVLAA